MDIVINKENMVVLDLDDTLYPEREYVKSGFKVISDRVSDLYGKDIHKGLVMLSEGECDDPIGDIIQQADLPLSLKPELIQLLRTHEPSITLFDGVVAFMTEVKARGAGLSLVSDGRSFTQRMKLKALGILCEFDHLFISSEIGSCKPSPKAFLLASQGYRSENCWYIGDNPSKDFIAPNKLGWRSVMLKGDGYNVHSQNFASGEEGSPMCVVNSFKDFNVIGKGV